MSLVAAFEPIWLLTALGYAARRWNLLGDEAAGVLGRFVFHLAMPAALFGTLSTLPVGRLADRSLLAFATSTALMIGFGWLVAGRLFDHKPADRTIWGMAAGYVNSANLGIPIAQQVLGNISFLAEVVLLQVLVLTPIILITLDRYGEPVGRVRFRRIASLPLRNPVILGCLLGVACSATGVQPPLVIAGSLRLLAGAAVPVALIALGASLRGEPGAAAAPAEIAVITALKLVAQPAIALAVGLALRLSHPQLLAVVICAGLPTAQNTFIFAQEYCRSAALASRAVLVTTTLSLASLAGIAAILGS